MQRARVNPAVATRGSSRPRFDVDKAETLLERQHKIGEPAIRWPWLVSTFSFERKVL